jgi:CHAT domain-containing protein/tetratricopeptide (TPR) repeat protein
MLGEIYGAQNKHAEAETFFRRSAEIREKLLGPAHPDTANSLRNLAFSYQAQSRYAEAELFHQRGIESFEMAVGPTHPVVGSAMAALALMYHLQGRTADAEAYYNKGLEIIENSLGYKSPEYDKYLFALLMLYTSQEMYAKAVPIHIRRLFIRESTVGPKHISLCGFLDELGVLLFSMGQYDEAEHYYLRSLSIREAELGREHLEISKSLDYLTVLYITLSRFAEASNAGQRSLSLRKKTLGTDHPEIARSLNNLAEAYRESGRYGDAEPLYLRSLVILEKASGANTADMALALNNLALLYQAQGRYDDAEPLYKRSLTIRENVLGMEHQDVAASYNNLSLLLKAQGRLSEAKAFLERGIAVAESALGKDHKKIGTILDNLAQVNSRLGRYSDAENLYKRALRIKISAVGLDHHEVARSFGNLAALHQLAGRSFEAENLYKRDIEINTKVLGPNHPEVATSLSNLGVLYISQNRFEDARQSLLHSLAIREATLAPDHPDVGMSLDNLAWLALSTNDLAEAAERWRRATGLLKIRSMRGPYGASEGSAKRETRRSDHYFKGLVKTTYRLMMQGRGNAGQLAEMFETAQWSVASEAAASLAQTAARSAGGSPELSKLVRERQDLMAEWQAKDKQLIAQKSEPAANRRLLIEKKLADRLAAIDARLGAIDRRLGEDYPDYAVLATPSPMGMAEVQSALGDDEALVLFVDTDDRFPNLPEETFVWIVTKSQARWHRSDLGTVTLRREVAALRCGLDETAWYGEGAIKCADLLKLPLDKAFRSGGPLPFDAARAHALYKGLIGEADDIIKGKHILMVPSGALTKLPFQVLVTSPPKPETAMKDVAWLTREHTITVLPSVSALTSLRRVAKPPRADRPMIGFGNPLLDGWETNHAGRAKAARERIACRETVFQRLAAVIDRRGGIEAIETRGGLADVAHLRMQSPLPETADELCTVARELGAAPREVRLGPNATEKEVKRLNASGELARYRIVHFATHGTLAGQIDGTREPGLILTPPATATAEDDGYLSGSEIANLKLDADWVILSACNTAGGDDAMNAEALSGLARVFFYAGARALLVSHWEVNSDATVKLITSAVGAMAKDKTVGRAESLRRAMLTMIDSGAPHEAHPAYWAPFIVVGEGAAAR